MTKSYYDGQWRMITDISNAAIDKLLFGGFEIRISKGRYMARWPYAQPRISLVFIGCPE